MKILVGGADPIPHPFPVNGEGGEQKQIPAGNRTGGTPAAPTISLLGEAKPV